MRTEATKGVVRLATVMAGMAMTMSGCGLAASRTTPTTSAVPVDVAVAPTSATAVDSTTAGTDQLSSNRDPGRAALLQVCVDLGAEVVAAAPTLVEQVLGALASAIETGTSAAAAAAADGGRHAANGFTTGFAVDVFVADDPAAGTASLVRGVVGDANRITLTPTNDLQLRQAQASEQREEALRAVAALDETAALIASLRSFTTTPATSSNVLGCVSRANRASRAYNPENRLLIVVSDFHRRSAGDLTIDGTLTGVRSVLLVEVGDAAASRRDSWVPTWTSVGADVRYVLPLVDVTEGSLDEHVSALLTDVQRKAS